MTRRLSRRLVSALLLLTFFLCVAFQAIGETPNARFTDWQVVGPNGGDVRDLVVDPKDKNRFYFSTLDGQIYTSSDAGKSWSLLYNFNRPQLVLDNLIIDSRDSKTLYVAGHRHKSPGGFFKSMDGGITWSESKDLKNEAIHALFQSDKNPDMLLAGTFGSLFISKDSGKNWEKVVSDSAPPADLIFDSIAVDPRDTNVMFVGTTHRAYKSIDGGKTWKIIVNGMIDDSDVFAIELDPRDPDHIVASACSGIYESKNGGELWSKIQGIPSKSRRTLAILRNPGKPEIIYAGTTEGFWMSSDGGKNWRVTTSRQLEINSITVHADEPDKVFIGTNNYGVLVSEDSGKTFLMTNGGYSTRQTNEIVPDIERSNRLYATTINTARGGGFIFISDDSGRTWTPSMKNVPADLITYSILQDKLNPNTIYLGTSAGIYRSVDRGVSWLPILPPKTNKAPVKRKTPAKTAVRKKTPATTIPMPTTTATVPAKPAVTVCPTKVNVLTLSIQDLINTNDEKNGLLAATGCGIYRSYDLTKGWEQLPFSAGTAPQTRKILASEKQPNTIWAGTASAGLLVSHDNGATWQTVEDIPNIQPISAIVIDWQRPENLYVGTKQTLYVSRDSGASWKRKGGGLPIGDYVTILINPGNPDEIFAGSSLETSGGVFQSTDAGEKWTRIDPKDQNLPSRRVWAIILDPLDNSRLLIASHSAGIYAVGKAQTSSIQKATRPRQATP